MCPQNRSKEKKSAKAEVEKVLYERYLSKGGASHEELTHYVYGLMDAEKVATEAGAFVDLTTDDPVVKRWVDEEF